MRMATVPILVLASLALAAPLACVAAPVSLEAQNCAEALASRMHVRLAAVNEQPNLQAQLPGSPHPVQYILRAQAPNGAQSRTMVCTVNRRGRVVSLHRTAPVDTLPLLDTASAQ